MSAELKKGSLFLVTTDRPTAGGWIDTGKHLLRLGEGRQGSWYLWARCARYAPLGSDERGYPIEHEHGGFGIGNEAIVDIVPVKESVERNAAGRDIRWCHISSAQVAELCPSWVVTKQNDLLENEILGLSIPIHETVRPRRGRTERNPGS